MQQVDDEIIITLIRKDYEDVNCFAYIVAHWCAHEIKCRRRLGLVI